MKEKKNKIKTNKEGEIKKKKNREASKDSLGSLRIRVAKI